MFLSDISTTIKCIKINGYFRKNSKRLRILFKGHILVYSITRNVNRRVKNQTLNQIDYHSNNKNAIAKVIMS